MQRAEPAKRVKIKAGQVLKYRVTCAELERLDLKTLPESAVNKWLRKLADQDFFELGGGFIQFKLDYIDRPGFLIEGAASLGWNKEELNRFKNEPDAQKLALTQYQVSKRLGVSLEVANAVIKSSGQDSAGFFHGLISHGVDRTKFNLIPLDDPKSRLIDVININQQIYCVVVTANQDMIADEISTRFIPGVNILIYRLEAKHDNEPSYKFVSAEFDNLSIYLMARSEQIPAEKLIGESLSRSEKPKVDLVSIIQTVKAKLLAAAKNDNQKILYLLTLTKEYKHHLANQIRDKLGAIVLRSLPSSDNQSYSETEKVATALRAGKTYKGPLEKFITPEVGDAMIKYQIIVELIALLDKRNHLHSSSALDEFETHFYANQHIIDKPRDNSTYLLFAKTIVWTAEGAKFTKKVLDVLDPKQESLEPTINLFNTLSRK